MLNTKANPLLTKIEQTSVDVCGKEVRKAVSFGLNGGIGAGDEDGELPTPNSGEFMQFVSPLKNLFGQICISDKAIRASADGKGAFTDLLNHELQSLLEASKFNLGRMLYGDGTGRLTKIGAKIADYFPVDKCNNIVEGMVVDIVSPLSETLATGLIISEVDRATKTIRFKVLPTCEIVTGSNLFIQGSFKKEIIGIEGIFTNDTLYGIDRTKRASLFPRIKKLNGLIDDIIIQEAIDTLEINSNSTVDYISCAADTKYAYQEYLNQYKRNVDIMELEGGYKSLSFNGIPLVYDRFVDDEKMYLLNSKSLKLHQLCDWRFLETENGKILRQNQNAASYSATLVKYCELICDKPAGMAQISGIKRTV